MVVSLMVMLLESLMWGLNDQETLVDRWDRRLNVLVGACGPWNREKLGQCLEL